MDEIDDFLNEEAELSRAYRKKFGEYPPVDLMVWDKEETFYNSDQVKKAIDENKPIIIDPSDIPTENAVY
tara:strand:- start:52 stop:261 length:210 start_codon:yes stop_codon:yes gene_type:complete